ncbi:MAG TPA: homocysteine S-methyltransferase family protein [Nocardioides sp.]|uniref:homocysteine S-methyltransferase family protein n=1 Tax=Nocardioides sp. TaxID=35761 RepID=UPI002E3638A3|nr:homocysteine S-methyltransferase family protein [Nocardioides sp.]HEX5088822.1 homocysteine S-methyltransferase family protein [Nocardioides sp.]
MDTVNDGRWVTDGGLETDLIFNHGADLPEFAAFPLVEDDAGAALLESYYSAYAEIAAAAGAGLLVETPTWRANPDWAARIGYDAAALDRANRVAVDLVRRVTERADTDKVLVSGIVGPRGDGYVAGGADPDEAADYHSAQIASFRAAGVDLVHVMTMTEPAEAIGVARAAHAERLPVAVSFTVETDGRLPDGTSLRDAVAQVDAAASPEWYGVNCAHPTHVALALDGGDWQERLVFLRPNTSTMSHEELDAMEELDAGDLPQLVSSAGDVRDQLPSLRVLGGCCGTDSRHVAAMWGVGPQTLT